VTAAKIAAARAALADGVARESAHQMLGDRDPAVCSCRECGWARGNGERYVSPATFTPEQLSRLTFEDAERMLHSGRIRQEDWEAYAHVWRTMSDRLSHVGAGYEAAPTDPLVVEIVAGIRAAVEARQAQR